MAVWLELNFAYTAQATSSYRRSVLLVPALLPRTLVTALMRPASTQSLSPCPALVAHNLGQDILAEVATS